MTLLGTLKNLGIILLFFLLFPLIPYVTGLVQKALGKMDPRAAVGVVPIKGILFDSSTINKQLHTFFKDKDIKAILLKIESPGSASGTGQAIFTELVALKKEYPKPVIALVENTCASGAYYIACASDHIIATPSAIIGSIGVAFSYFFQLKAFIEQFNVKYIPMQAGTYKNATNPLVDVSPADKAMLQKLLDDTYEQFTSDVAQQRKLSLTHKDQWANGKLFTGRQALKLGLIDEIGSATQAIKTLKEKAAIEVDIKWVHPPKVTAFSRLFGGEPEDENTIFSNMVNELCRTLETRYATQVIS